MMRRQKQVLVQSMSYTRWMWESNVDSLPEDNLRYTLLRCSLSVPRCVSRLVIYQWVRWTESICLVSSTSTYWMQCTATEMRAVENDTYPTQPRFINPRRQSINIGQAHALTAAGRLIKSDITLSHSLPASLQLDTMCVWACVCIWERARER